METLIHPIHTESCTKAWLEGVEYLLAQPDREAYNLILGINSPREMAPVDFAIFDLVDGFLRETNQLPITTVAGTIFPANHYLRNQAAGVYEEFPEEISKLPKSSWGTYAMRLLRKEGKNGTFNPLEQLVEKIRRLRNLNRSAYEINFVDDDLEEILEIPIYSTKDDYKLHIPQPCLSHLTFKLYEGESLRLTVLYRSHFYVTKALGNLLGLAQLQSFVAAETGLEVGPLVCHSTHARIDTGKGVTLQRVEKLIAACRDAMRSEEVVEQ
jgi:hypothetical protein